MQKNRIKYIKRSIVVVGIVSVLVAAYYIQDKKRQEKFHQTEVQEYYHANMKAKNEAILYRKSEDTWQAAGFLYKDAEIELSSINSDYYQIKSTDYYVYYKDVLPIEPEKDSSTPVHSPYLLWNIDVKTNIPTVLMEDGTKKYSLDMSIQAPVIKKDKGTYTILLENKQYQVEATNVQEEVATERTIAPAEKISILYFQDETNIEERINYLQEEGYTFINEKILLEFLNKQVFLPEKTVMIVQKEANELSDLLVKNNQIEIQPETSLSRTYQDQDLQASPENPNVWYQITSQTTEKRFQEMLVGKKEIIDKAEQIPVLNYHFFYDSQTEACNESICLEKKNFAAQLEYLKQNQYKTLTMQEFNDWLDKKIELPKKSVLITIDDGAMGTDTHLPQLLNQYDMKATLFLISGWWPLSKYTTGNLEIQSHGHELHHNNFCSSGKCGIKGLLISKEEAKADLILSKNTIGNPIAFCYPFYAYNDTLTAAVKETFSLAFIGGNRKVPRNTDKYKIPRYIIYKNTSLENFKKMIEP